MTGIVYKYVFYPKLNWVKADNYGETGFITSSLHFSRASSLEHRFALSVD
jgi:hypothetical protein